MILNAYTVLAAFAALCELALGAVACAVAFRVLRARRAGGPSANAAPDADARTPLLDLTGVRLAVIALASVPLLYLVLRSSVTEWPGVMCIAGVLKIGSFSVGPASWLRTLLATAAAAKALTVLGAGAWLALRSVDARTASAPLAGRVAFAIALTGALACADGAASLGYLAIPKREVRLVAGCCSEPAPRASAEGNVDLASAGPRRARWTIAFFAGGAAMTGLLGGTLRSGLGGERLGAAERGWWAPTAGVGAAATAVAGAGFAAAALAPERLARPLHECLWCLLDGAPELWVGVLLFLAATACAVWAAVVAGSARREDVRPAAARVLRRLTSVACFGYAAALVTAAAERWLV